MPGQVYYIDTNIGAPARLNDTVAAIVKVLKPGDSVLFRSGVYTNATYGDGNIWKDGQDIVLRINGAKGAPDAPITFAAAPGERVVLRFDGNGGVRVTNSSFVNLRGFEIEGPARRIAMKDALANQFAYRLPNDTRVYYRNPYVTLAKSVAAQGGYKPNYYNSNGVMIGSGANHITIAGNAIHDAPGYGVSSLAGADYLTISGNTIFNNSWWSGGAHGVSIQNVASSDAFDGVKILVEGNVLHDNYNRLISWSLTKTAPVTLAIDEGKGIQFQDSTAALGFAHGRIQVDDNLVVRSGNAGVSTNNVERATFVFNTLADNGYVNQLIAQGLADPKLSAAYRVTDGGVRLQGGAGIGLYNTLIAQRAGLNAIEASQGMAAGDADVRSNMYSGGVASNASGAPFAGGLRFVADPGFVDSAHDNYRLRASSPAVNAGANALSQGVKVDLAGNPRNDGRVDIGALEYVATTAAR